MTLWMLWGSGVAAALGFGGLTAERALAATGRPLRWAWCASLAISIGTAALSLADRLVPDTTLSGAGGRASDVIGAWLSRPLDALAVAAPGPLAALDPFLTAGWALATAALLGCLGGGLVRLSRRARYWPRARIGDLEALLSDGFGPALLGPVHARIVVPRALLAHDPGAARIACVHEDEHRRAGDAWLLLGGALAAAVAPWNPAIWWQLSRLRLAMEVDCDRRVLRRGVPRATYAALLLELGTRAPGAPLQVATLARPTSMLERRLSTMMRNDQSGRPLRAACLTAAAVILTATACEAPEPVAVRIDEQDQPADVTREQDGPLSRVGTSGVPLVYLDGVRFEGDLDALDRQDIARVEIVKGEAAAARYGLAARGGVIRIFTHAATGVGAASPSS